MSFDLDAGIRLPIRPMTPDQCRAARGLLGWSQDNLATAAQVSIRTIQAFELGQRDPIPATVAALQRALEEAGVEFIAGGVRRRSP